MSGRPEFLRLLKENRECCAELWFSNGILYIPLGKHRQKAAEQMRCAEELRAAGIIPSIQIQATMGHSDAFCTPDTLKTMTWGAYVGRNGKQCRYCSCTRQEDFLEYFREVARRWIFTLVAYEPRNIVKQVNSSIFVTFEAFFNVLIQYISRE